MSIVQGLNRQQYQLDSQPFSKGGEGDIHNLSYQRDHVAKLYHSDRLSKELESKLKIMVSRPPSQAVLSQVAWPLDVVYDTSGQFCGFIMPKLDIDIALRDLYVYPSQKYKNVSISQKICIAQNICAVISEVHKAGYVFGDFNPLNIGINLTDGKVAFLDTDSYHITDQTTGNTYRCKVCLDGYVAPELLKACENYPKDAYATAPLPTFTKETDNFALAIHIFKLLMNGYTPYNGIPETVQGSTASPGVGNNAIKRDSYCFKPGNKPQAVAVPSLDVLPQEIADLFTRAFMLGKLDPKQRPDAVEWHTALGRYEQSLQTCHRNPAHQYRNGLPTCPWCEADQRYVSAMGPTIPQRTFPSPVMPPGVSGQAPSRTSPPAQVPVNAGRKIIGFIIALVTVIGVCAVIGIMGIAQASRNNFATSYSTPTTSAPSVADTGGTPTLPLITQKVTETKVVKAITPTDTIPTKDEAPKSINLTDWKQGNIAYTARNDQGAGLYLLNTETGDQELLLTGKSENYFLGASVSPDGKQVAYYQYPDLMYLMNLNTRAEPVLVGNCQSPTWKSDSQTILCRSNGNVLKWSNGKTIPEIKGLIPALAPNNLELVYAVFEGERTSIYLSTVNGESPVLVAGNSSENYAPAWSPSGDWIAYQSNEGSQSSEIWIMDKGGKNKKRLTYTDGGKWSRAPSWSPDGQWIAYVSSQSSSIGADFGEIFIVSMKTGETTQLTNTDGKVYDWRVSWVR